MTWLLRAVVVGAALGAAGGCGSKSGAAADLAGKEALEDLERYLKSDGVKPPAKLADLEPIDPAIPQAGPAIRNGDVVYFWGNGISAGGAAVIAHEKNAESAGGWVLMQNGDVKKMSADEYKAAPKAAKK